MTFGDREGPSRKENAGTVAEPPVSQYHQASEPQAAPAIVARRTVCPP